MKNKKKKILVIGGTGFIGFHLLKQTSQLGWNSVSVSKHKPKKSKLIKKVKYISINIKSFKNFKNKIKGDFDYIVNLIDSPNKNLNPEIKKLITFFLNKKIKKFVQIGSSAEYGNIKKPHSENLKCRPSSFYGKKKLEITNFLVKKFKQNLFPAVILRPFQVYGASDNKNKILPHILNGCLKNKKFNLTKGFQTRDFCYVDDVIRAIILMLKTTNKNVIGKIFNVGTGKSITIKKLVEIIQKKTNGGKPVFGKKALKKNEILFSQAHVGKIKKYINWSSKISIENGINILIKNGK